MVIMMRNKSTLKLNTTAAMRKITGWKLDYPNNEFVNLKFTDAEILGNGRTRYFECSDSVDMYIGIAPLSTSFFNRRIPINDLDFVIMGTTFFHEMAHYQGHVSNNTDDNIMFPDLSTQHNNNYYHAVHHLLPHEIDAEYSGVMSMWNALESEYPDTADKLMFDYLDYRTASSDRTKKLYMIERPEGGFSSKQQVKDLFNEAYEKSLTDKRYLPDELLGYSDDISKLITTDDRRGIRIEYVPIYLTLSKAESGSDLDLKIASLVSYIHPELQNIYRGIDFNELEPIKVFGLPIPETTDEVRLRLGYDASFAAAIDYVTKLDNNAQEL